MSNNGNKKFPTEMVLPAGLLAGFILITGEGIGRGVSRIDEPITYWVQVTLLIGFVLYKLAEYFDL
jgi:hypothetical protein